MDNLDTALKADEITKTVLAPGGPLCILQPSSLTIARGESVAVIGPSGSGKTTLLGLLAGLDLPTQGRIWMQGEELTCMSEDARARLRAQNVGFVFQSFHLLASLTAHENVRLPLELANTHDADRRVRDILRRVGLIERAAHYPNQLSGGEKQRVAIARAFATNPALLFADEPTGNLDTATGRQISDLLFELNAQHQTTLVMVTHDEALAARCGRLVRLQAGRIERDTQTAAVLA